MGALFFMNDTYRETLPIIDASGLPTFPFSTSNNVNEWVFDSKSGHVQQMTSQSSLTKSPLLQAEIDRYIKFWNTEFAPLNVIGYKVRFFYCKFLCYLIDSCAQNGVKGYTMSTFDWLRANNYPLLLLLFIKGMVAYGYGDIMQVPAVRIFLSLQILTRYELNVVVCVVDLYASTLQSEHFTFHCWSKGGLHDW